MKAKSIFAYIQKSTGDRFANVFSTFCYFYSMCWYRIVGSRHFLAMALNKIGDSGLLNTTPTLCYYLVLIQSVFNQSILEVKKDLK